MDTRIDEIEDRIYRISTFVPEIAEPAGFTFNQYLLDAGEPLLFHTALAALADGYEKRFAPRPASPTTAGC